MEDEGQWLDEEAETPRKREERVRRRGRGAVGGKVGANNVVGVSGGVIKGAASRYKVEAKVRNDHLSVESVVRRPLLVLRPS